MFSLRSLLRKAVRVMYSSRKTEKVYLWAVKWATVLLSFCIPLIVCLFQCFTRETSILALGSFCCPVEEMWLHRRVRPGFQLQLICFCRLFPNASNSLGFTGIKFGPSEPRSTGLLLKVDIKWFLCVSGVRSRCFRMCGLMDRRMVEASHAWDRAHHELCGVMEVGLKG